MIPINFKESNYTFKGGEGVKDLKVFMDTESDEIISCWKANWRERLAILFTGKVWLGVTGNTTPPVFVNGTSLLKEKP